MITLPTAVVLAPIFEEMELTHFAEKTHALAQLSNRKLNPIGLILLKTTLMANFASAGYDKFTVISASMNLDLAFDTIAKTYGDVAFVSSYEGALKKIHSS